MVKCTCFYSRCSSTQASTWLNFLVVSCLFHLYLGQVYREWFHPSIGIIWLFFTLNNNKGDLPSVFKSFFLIYDWDEQHKSNSATHFVSSCRGCWLQRRFWPKRPPYWTAVPFDKNWDMRWRGQFCRISNPSLRSQLHCEWALLCIEPIGWSIVLHKVVEWRTIFVIALVWIGSCHPKRKMKIINEQTHDNLSHTTRVKRDAVKSYCCAGQNTSFLCLSEKPRRVCYRILWRGWNNCSASSYYLNSTRI